MPLNLALSRGFAWSDSSNGEPNTVLVTATNPGATALVLSSLQVTEVSKTGANVTQPLYLVPNMPIGLGNPIILPGASASYSFEVSFTCPAYSGPAPQTPGGAGGVQGPPTNTGVTLMAQCLSSDGVVTSVTQPFPVLSTVAPFPVAQGGAMQLGSGFNIIYYITSFA